MIKFEYTILTIEVTVGLTPHVNEQALKMKLNEYGSEGWELVSILPVCRSSGVTQEAEAVFKRPL